MASIQIYHEKLLDESSRIGFIFDFPFFFFLILSLSVCYFSKKRVRLENLLKTHWIYYEYPTGKETIYCILVGGLAQKLLNDNHWTQQQNVGWLAVRYVTRYLQFYTLERNRNIKNESRKLVNSMFIENIWTIIYSETKWN